MPWTLGQQEWGACPQPLNLGLQRLMTACAVLGFQEARGSPFLGPQGLHLLIANLSLGWVTGDWKARQDCDLAWAAMLGPLVCTVWSRPCAGLEAAAIQTASVCLREAPSELIWTVS